MAETDDIFGTSGNVGAIAGVESSLSPYAGPYVTEMLGKVRHYLTCLIKLIQAL